MFKSRFGLSIILIILFSASLLMTYIILFDLDGFQELIGAQEEETTDVLNQEQAMDVTENYLQPTDVTFQDAIAPKKMFVRLGQQSYVIQDDPIKNIIRSLIESRPFSIESVQSYNDPVTYNTLYEVDHIQLVTPERLPIGLFTRLFSIEEGLAQDVYFDRIIVPISSQESNEAYLVDSQNESYIIAQLSSNLSTQEFRTAVTRNEANLVEVLRYPGEDGPIYLPVNDMTMRSHLFTLDTIPEAIYIRDIFSSNNYTPTEVSDGLFRYQNYQYTLEVNRELLQFSLTINRIGQGDPRTITEKLRNSYSLVQEYEYWDRELALTDFTNNLVTYRRYYEGYPILTNSSMADYGATRVQLRGDLSGDIYRYQQPLVKFYAYINHIYEDYPLANHEAIVELLDEKGYALSQFDNIFIGYEWQENMEDFRKAELIPTWYFELNGQHFTIAEIETNEFREAWEAYQTYLDNLNGGEN